MQDRFKLPALDGCVVIDGNTVSVIDDEGTGVTVSKEEWEYLRADLHFDDAVLYENGESPMTLYQFQSFLTLYRETERLEAENDRLNAESKILKDHIKKYTQ